MSVDDIKRELERAERDLRWLTESEGEAGESPRVRGAQARCDYWRHRLSLIEDDDE